MANRQHYSSFAEMPPGLRQFLFSHEFNAIESTLQSTYSLSDDQKILVGDCMMDAIFGDLGLGDVVEKFKQTLVPAPLDEKKWKDFLTDFLKLEAWPLRDLFGEELTKVLADNQISTAGWPNSKVYLKPMTYSGASTEVAAQAGFSLLGPQMRERLRDLILTRQKGVRVDSQVLEVLRRPADFGGLGLDQAMAQKALDAINSLIASVKILSEEEYADWLAEETRKKTPTPTEPVPGEEEDPEIAKLKASMPVAPPTVLDEAIEKTVAALDYRPETDYLKSRLAHVISSRMRDVRSDIELVQLLQRDTKVGGLGLDRETAEKVGGQIETSYHEFHDRILDEEKGKIEKQLNLQKQKIEERKRQEAEEHARWYQEKVLSRKQEEESHKKLAAEMQRTFSSSAPAAPAHPMDAREQKVESARFGSMINAVGAGAAPLAPVEPKVAGPNPPAKPTAAPAQGQAAHPEIKISKETILQPSGPKPKLEDVKYAGPRLTGLVDELRRMDLSEFRRLAKEPEIAAAKILQKLETLGQESFEKRIAGVQAFQGSPLQQVYMSLVAQSFRSSKSVMDIAESQRSEGKDTLSPAEISAVISLNSKIHF